MIPIFKYEIQDNIAELVKSNASVAILSSIQGIEPTNEQIEVARSSVIKASDQARAEANPCQFDLFYIESILASTGWNKNDDVFDRFETWQARSTPVDKQFNYMHNEKDIIGHITSTRVVSLDSQLIDMASAIDDLPQDFEIVVGSVLYRAWSDPDLQSRINNIIAGITNGEWFVSMECLFRNFDYAIIDPDGDKKVIARNEESSFLTKHLKIYGGTGEYQGYRVGRLLKDFVFSGKGLVDKPANPRSFIINFNNRKEVSSFAGTVDNINNLKGEFLMAAENIEMVSKAEYDALKKELEAAKSKEIQELQSKLGSAEASVSQAVEELRVNKEVMIVKDEKIVALEKQVAELQAGLNEAESKLDNIKKEAVKAARLQKLMSKDISEDKAADLIDKFASVADDMFDSLLNSLPEKKAESKSDDKKEDKEDKEDMKKKEDKKADASTESLEDVKATVDVDMNVDNKEIESIVSKASAWLQDSILRTTASKK